MIAECAIEHSWQDGDLVNNDNISMLHTRSSFKTGVDREL
jgi:alpha-ketoglutarate-dependent taurine dioxygenase